ncbi:MAG: protein-methionine-sulfoxide reductase catalytic subunit MsrP [Phycisphaeraceae bacterium]
MRRAKLPKLNPTPELVYLNRRQFIRQIGAGTATLAAAASITWPLGCTRAETNDTGFNVLTPGLTRPDVLAHFPAPRNERFNFDRPLTDQTVAATHNNFYEFRPGRAGDLWRLTNEFITDPWTIEVVGQCHKPRKFSVDDIFKLPAEERTYRFRCVEAWAMDVPWTGFELNRLLKQVEPTADARFVRFTCVNRPDQMPGLKQTPHYPWPYFEALRMDEAMHELTLLVTGVYGRPLPRQHGAPFRIIVPWKYGYKSPKAIVKIELTEKQPPTFWNTLQPHEYDFLSNVNPHVPHPRWSQATERLLGTNDRRPTLFLNGYANDVAKLYT